MSHFLSHWLIGALAASIGLACAGAALADPNAAAFGPGYTAADAPLGDPTELRIDLRGEVSARCEVAPPSGLGRMNLNEAGEVRGAFGIVCNTPFLLRVRSDAGGLASVGALAGVAQLADYELAVEVGTDAGRQDLGWCDAAALGPDAAGPCAYSAQAPLGGWSSGEAVAIRETGSLTLRWDGQRQDASAPRLGAYRDNIIIEVEVRS